MAASAAGIMCPRAACPSGSSRRSSSWPTRSTSVPNSAPSARARAESSGSRMTATACASGCSRSSRRPSASAATSRPPRSASRSRARARRLRAGDHRHRTRAHAHLPHRLRRRPGAFNRGYHRPPRPCGDAGGARRAGSEVARAPVPDRGRPRHRPADALVPPRLPAVHRLINGATRLLLRLVGGQASPQRHLHSPDEIELLIAESHDGGLLESDEQQRLRRALRSAAARRGISWSRSIG